MSDPNKSALPGGRRGRRTANWNPGARRAADVDSLWWKRFLGGLGVIACVGLIAWMISWLYTPPGPGFAVFGDQPRATDLSAPFHLAGWTTARQLVEAADAYRGQRHRVQLFADRAGGGPVPLSDLKATLTELVRHRSELLVAYFSQPGSADADGPFLFDAAGRRVAITAILDQIKILELGRKTLLLVFDPAAESPDALPGVTTNTFTEALGELADKPGTIPAGVVLFVGSGRGQVSFATEEWRATAFGHFFLAALQTRAAEGDIAGVLSLKRLIDWTTERTRRWAALNRDSATGRAAQVPVLFAADPKKLANVQLIPWDRDRVEPRPQDAPGREFGEESRDRIERAWAVVDALAGELPGPEVYTPIAWSRLRLLTARFEQCVRFGEPTAEIEKERERLVRAIELGRGLAVRETVVASSLAMPVALGLDRAPSGPSPRLLPSPRSLYDSIARSMGAAPELVRDLRAIDGLIALANRDDARWFAEAVRECALAVDRRPSEWHVAGYLTESESARRSAVDAVQVRRLAERVALAVDPDAARRSHPYSEWQPKSTRDRIFTADRLRRVAEDRLFSHRSADQDPARSELDRLRDVYRAIAAEQKPLRDALAVRDRAISELPWLTRWLMAHTSTERPADADAAVSAWREVGELGRSLAAIDPLNPNAPPPDPERLKSSAESLRRSVVELIGRYEQAVEAERRSTELLPKHWRDIALLLSGPPPLGDARSTAAARADLVVRARSISRKLLEQEPNAKLLDALSGSSGDPDTRAYRDRLTAAARMPTPTPTFDPDRDEPARRERLLRWKSLFAWLAERQLLDHWTDGDRPFSTVRAEALLKPWADDELNPPFGSETRERIAALNQLAAEPLLLGKSADCFRDTKRLMVPATLTAPPPDAEPGQASVTARLRPDQIVRLLGSEAGVQPLTAGGAVEWPLLLERPGEATPPSGAAVALTRTAFYRGRARTVETEIRLADVPYLVLSRPSPEPVASVAARGGENLVTGSVAIILDCSGSMVPDPKRGRLAPPGSRYRRAIDGLKTLLESLPERTPYSVRVFSDIFDNANAPNPPRLLIQPQPWRRDQLDGVVSQLNALVPYGDTPLSQAMAMAAREELAVPLMQQVGQRNLIVLSDGQEMIDNVASTPAQIAGRMAGVPDGIAIHLLLFEVDQKETDDTAHQFQVLQKRTPPGTIRRAVNLDVLRQTLLDSLRPQLRLVGVEAPRAGYPTIRGYPKQIEGLPLNAELEWWLKPILRPAGVQAYRAETIPISGTNARLVLAPGDRLLLDAIDKRFVRRPWFLELESTYHREGHNLPKKSLDGWTLTAPRNGRVQRQTSKGLDNVLTLEANPFDEPEVRQVRPAFVWWEAPPTEFPTGTVQFRETFFYPAPAWKWRTESWPDSAGALPQLRAWWATEWPDSAVKFLGRYTAPRAETFAPTEAPRLDVRVESNAVPKDWPKADGAAESTACVVVQMEWPIDRGPYFAMIDSGKVTGWEHRFYKDAGRQYYTGWFWGGVTEDAAEYSIRVISLPDWKESVERWHAAGEFRRGGHLREAWELPRPTGLPYELTPITD